MDLHESGKNTLEWYHLGKESMIGNREWKGRTDLINIIMIGLTSEVPEYNEEHKLHRLLCTLFSAQLEAEEKIAIMENEYHIRMKETIREEIEEMCNLGRGVREEGIREGIRQGRILERERADREKQRADELERQNIRFMELLVAHGITV